MRLSQIVVSLPLLLCATQVSQPISLAHAAVMDATEATELLAKSHAINVKCNVLSADQSQTLRDYVARAEISLAEQASVSVARKTISSGKSQGKAAMCDDTAKKLVNDILAAANAATAAPIDDQTKVMEPASEPTTLAAIPEPNINAEPKPEENAVAIVAPVSTPRPLKSVKPQKPVTNVKPAKTVKPIKVTKPAKGLKTYASVAEKYYVASRCGSMGRSEINALYKQVLVNHRQAMAGNRPGAVRAMLQSAEARAGTKSCT